MSFTSFSKLQICTFFNFKLFEKTPLFNLELQSFTIKYFSSLT